MRRASAGAAKETSSFLLRGFEDGGRGGRRLRVKSGLAEEDGEWWWWLCVGEE